MNILLLDNYDSFTFNIAHIVRELGLTSDLHLDIIRNDKILLSDIAMYDKIILSPGPGIPSEAGVMPALLRRFGKEKPVLGVCLGHQAIGEVFGGTLINLSKVHHGVATQMEVVADDLLFNELPRTFDVGRYHSWIVDSATLPECLLVTAVDAEGQIMALRHKEFPVRGVQFHPESVLTQHGFSMLKNWIES